MINKKYGVVYTPGTLADFVAGLLFKYCAQDVGDDYLILDPASGECSLLRAAKELFGKGAQYVGIDIDKDAVNRSKTDFNIVHDDAILPQRRRRTAAEYWKRRFKGVDAIIANPPWSSEKVYDNNVLEEAGYSLASGQYDSYVLFMELAYNLLKENGIMAFIIPDSLFDAQNIKLRQLLSEKTQILVLARLGEKLFDEVNRATTVVVCRKAIPTEESETTCFRLTTDDRKAYLSGKGSLTSFFNKKRHVVKQKRFINNSDYHFDVDLHAEEENLINKIQKCSVELQDEFKFGRGVEISKSGRIVVCPDCGAAQGYSKKQMMQKTKTCTRCGNTIAIRKDNTESVIGTVAKNNTDPIFVGENIQRYSIRGNSYIKLDVDGINYKKTDLYTSPKLLIRKTGLGIYGAIDYTGTKTSQTVYILKYIDENNTIPLEYYLALINSRVVYYYYLKVYGENEWKSHPYLTKQIIFSFPIRKYVGDEIDDSIVRISKKLAQKYDSSLDIKLEKLIMKKYGLSDKEQIIIADEMNRLPDLSAINNMKMEA